MDQDQILQFIKATETAAIDPDTAAEIYAFALSVLEPHIPEANMRQLLLLGAAMYRNSVIVDTQHSGLQIPTASVPAYSAQLSEYIQ